MDRAVPVDEPGQLRRCVGTARPFGHWFRGSATTPTTFSKRRSATTLPRFSREESTAARRSRLPLALAALFDLFVKRERPQQVSYRILPNFVEFLVGRLDLGCRDR